MAHKAMHQRIERFARVLDTPFLNLIGPIEIDKVYVSGGKKGCERDRESRLCGLSTSGLGSAAKNHLCSFPPTAVPDSST
jgi:hypothetical protein